MEAMPSYEISQLINNPETQAPDGSNFCLFSSLLYQLPECLESVETCAMTQAGPVGSQSDLLKW